MKKLIMHNLKHVAAFCAKRVVDKIFSPVNNRKATFIITLSIPVLSALSACTQVPEKHQDTAEQTRIIANISVSTTDVEEYQNGLIALNDNNESKAEAIFNEFIEDKPELAGPYTNLALIHFKKKEYDLSLELVNKALMRNPEQAQAYQLRSQIFVTKGKIHDAKKDYIKAIELKPDYINAHYNLALLYDIYLQEISLAIKHYEVYLSLIEKPDEATKEWVNHLKGS